MSHQLIGFARRPYLAYYPSKDLLAPHKITDYKKVDALVESIREQGWIGDALVGYPWENKLQLVTGTHRLAACVILDRLVPVHVYKRSRVWNAFGDVSRWQALIRGELYA